MSRYFEIIITGRQLAAGVGAVVLLLAVAFALGVAVRWFEPSTPPQEYIAAAPAVTTAGPASHVTTTPAPTALPAAAAPSGPVASVGAPTAAPTAAAAMVATRQPTAQAPTPAVAASPSVTAAPMVVPAQTTGRWVQATALSRRDQADGVRTRVIALGFAASQVVVQPAPHGKFRIRVGPFPDGESAGRVAARLQAQGFKGAFVVKAGE